MMENEENKIEPTVVTYSSLFKACARTRPNAIDPKEQNEALAIAMDAFKLLQNSNSITANNVIYRVLMDVADNLILDETNRTKFVQQIFSQCCKDGFLDNIMLSKVRKSIKSDKLFIKMIGGYNKLNDRSFGVNMLPPAWSMHLHRGEK